MEEKSLKSKITQLIIIATLTVSCVMGVCQILADQTRDPQIMVSAEYISAIAIPESFIDVDDPRYWYEGFEISVLSPMDKFTISMNSYYSANVFFYWLGGSEDLRWLGKEYGTAGTSTVYTYQALNATDFSVIIRVEFSDSQMFFRSLLGRNLNTDILNIPLFIIMFGLIILAEKTGNILYQPSDEDKEKITRILVKIFPLNERSKLKVSTLADKRGKMFYVPKSSKLSIPRRNLIILIVLILLLIIFVEIFQQPISQFITGGV